DYGRADILNADLLNVEKDGRSALYSTDGTPLTDFAYGSYMYYELDCNIVEVASADETMYGFLKPDGSELLPAVYAATGTVGDQWVLGYNIVPGPEDVEECDMTSYDPETGGEILMLIESVIAVNVRTDTTLTFDRASFWYATEAESGALQVAARDGSVVCYAPDGTVLPEDDAAYDVEDWTHGYDFYYNDDNTLTGVLDPDGVPVTEAVYGGVDLYTADLGWFVAYSPDSEANRCGVIDIHGNEIIPIDYDIVVDWADLDNGGDVIVLMKDGVSGVMNTEGNVVLPFEYDDIVIINDRILALKDDLYGVYAFDGTMLLPHKFEALINWYASQGYIGFRTADEIGYMDTDYNVVRSVSLNDYEAFMDYSLCLGLGDANGNITILNVNGDTFAFDVETYDWNQTYEAYYGKLLTTVRNDNGHMALIDWNGNVLFDNMEQILVYDYLGYLITIDTDGIQTMYNVSIEY
ncbi:MAG: WG repeat-containing protein, partial [Clostridia bacterium]|nr:WG repeat-containing protein [Clostridia bacterium]